MANNTVINKVNLDGIFGMAFQMIKGMNINKLYKKTDCNIIITQFIDPNILDESLIMTEIDKDPDPVTQYQCTEYQKGSNLIKLHKWVLLTKQYPFLENKIKEYCQLHPEDINKMTHDREYTPLMLAVLNLDKVSTFKTIEILLEAGADPNAERTTDKTTILDIVSDEEDLARLDLYTLLLKYKADVTHVDKSIMSRPIIESFIVSCKPNNPESDQIIDLLIDHGVDLSQYSQKNVLDKYYQNKINQLEKENEIFKSHMESIQINGLTIKI